MLKEYDTLTHTTLRKEIFETFVQLYFLYGDKVECNKELINKELTRRWLLVET